MQKITPFLWFDDKAEEAAKLYVSIFENSGLGRIDYYGKAGAEVSGRKEGSIMTVEFQLNGQEFIALNGGLHFKFSEAISLQVKCRTKDEVDSIWAKLSEGGKVLMELGEYPFSERYGWLNDRYGLSWQIIYVGESEIKQKITPTLMFVGNVCGKAEEAMKFYTSVFHNSRVGMVIRHEKGEEPDREGTVKYASFALEGMEFGAMDSAHEHHFTFTEAISFVVNCETQEEVDYYWENLSRGGEEVQCGWLKDKYGISWQIVPIILGELMKNPEKSEKVMQTMLKMKKLDIKELKEACDN